MHWHRIIHLALAWGATFGKAQFVHPPPQSDSIYTDDNPVWPNGSTQGIEWTGNGTDVALYLYQNVPQGLLGNPSVLNSTIYNSDESYTNTNFLLFDGLGNSYVYWTVSDAGFNVTLTNQFYLLVYLNDGSAHEPTVSHNFNITAASTSASTTVTLATSTITSSPIATGGITTSAKTGLGVGIGLGLPLAAAAGVIAGLFISRMKAKKQSTLLAKSGKEKSTDPPPRYASGTQAQNIDTELAGEGPSTSSHAKHYSELGGNEVPQELSSPSTGNPDRVL